MCIISEQTSNFSSAMAPDTLYGILARVAAGHYAVLELARGASQKDVRQSYLRLSLKSHPDKNPNCSERAVEAFVAIRCVRVSVFVSRARALSLCACAACVCVCVRAWI
jgi:predicted transcriptional regulator of viral defense system